VSNSRSRYGLLPVFVSMRVTNSPIRIAGPTVVIRQVEPTRGAGGGGDNGC
jgi:hypothetical protein